MAEGTRTVMGSESKVSRVFHFTFRRCVGIAFSFAQVLSMCLSAQTAGAQAAPVGLSTETIAARAVPATVTIVTFGVDGDTIGMGSGFLVGPTGVIVTNFHVMAGASKAAVLLTNGERYEWVQALGTDATADLAILKIPGYGLPTLLTSPTLPPAGARLIAVGNPLGLSSTVTEGIVSAVRRFEDRQILQMSAAISVGSSGGPVLNGRGEVVAVATSFLRVGQNLNFAVPVRYAMGLLEAGGRPVTVAEAFASAGIDDPAPDALANGTAETRGRAQREGEQRAVMPRSSVVGAYAVSQETWVTHRGQAPTEPVEGSGLLLLGTHDNGFYVSIMGGDTAESNLGVFSLTSITTATDGRLVAELGGLTWTGYQTEDGLYLESAVAPGAEREGMTVRLRGKATTIALSSPSGLYDLEIRSAYTLKGRHVDYTDWTGEAAVVTAHDSIYVDLWLENPGGGNVGAYAGGDLRPDGTFDLKTRTGKRLTGRIGGGRFVAEWIDPREQGQFHGTLKGRHR